MSESEVKTAVNISWSKYAPIILLAALGILLVIVGLRLLTYQDKQEIEIIHAQDEEIAEAIKVDVGGAVMKPGLISLKQGSRVQDALDAAGGMHTEADAEWIAKNLNLAQIIKDGQKIYVPRVGEKISEVDINTEITAGIIAHSQLININNATQIELEELEGVGPVTAEKIIAGRPYSDVNDLLYKNIIGQSLFEKIKSYITQ